jgi:putative endonuclease
MWFVYMVECADGSLYTGIARDLEQRIATHNAGKGSRYTRSRLPVRLVWSETARDRSTASQREAQIKSMGRNAKLALI